MTSGQLEALFAVAEFGSMNKAAESIFVSQPALKKRLDSLEDELGFALLQRSASGCALTEAGDKLCSEIKPLYVQMKSTIERIKNSTSPMKIRISQVSYLTLRFCDQLLTDFLHEHQNISIERVFLTNDLWFDALYAGEIDMCLVPGTQEAIEAWKRKGLTCIQYDEGQLACLVSRSHPLAGYHQISLDQLKPYTVYAEPLMMEYGGLSRAADEQDVRLNSDHSVYNRYEMIDACRRGMVYLHDISLTPDVFPLTVIPITDFSYGRLILLRNDRDPALRTMKTFLISQTYVVR